MDEAYNAREQNANIERFSWTTVSHNPGSYIRA